MFSLPAGLAKAVEDDSSVYVIMLNNDVTRLLQHLDGPELLNATTPDIVSCDETRAFWVSWADRIIGRWAQPSRVRRRSHDLLGWAAQGRDVDAS